MIIVDPRSGSEPTNKTTSVDYLVSYIRQIGIPCEKGVLEFGDAAFEGNGPHGRIMIGIERKTLHDMLHCIDDNRFTGHQRIGMMGMFAKSFLIVEGAWKPHNPEGWLMEGFKDGWGFCKYRSQRTLYAKLYRYLLSVSMSGITVTYSRDLWHTAFNICETFTYFQKRWEDHTSLLELQKFALPDMNGRPSLVRKWANALEDIGAKLSIEAESRFKTPVALANADEPQWMSIKGIGVKTARKIVKEIQGWR